MEWRPERAFAAPGAAKAAAPTVRLAQVGVRAPFDGRQFAVLRPDGSVAFDPFNAFAAHPAALIRGAAEDALAASGAFSHVVAANSPASARFELEVSVTRLALDCTAEGRRDAVVSLSCALIEGRRAVAAAHGEGASPTADGDYSAAFSRAFSSAVASAVAALGDEIGK